ncbi:MAG: hypothetical protein IPK82_29990 [Polyangiaceae bacterium]|nr:hypothetical protein [Polyangiaceae bacterium]
MAEAASRMLVLVTAAAAIGLSACSGGGGGDPPSEPAASVLGKGLRVSDVLGEAEWFDASDKDSVSCAVPADRTVNITGVTVTALDRFDEVADGALGNLYVQDTTPEPGEYQGMTVFDPAFTPPDLRVARGDVLDMFGVMTEFLGPSSGYFGKCKTLPEVGGTGSFRFEGSKVPPKTVPLQDIFGYENARRYMGMLIRLEDVTIGNDPASSNDALPSGGRYTVELDRTGIDTTGVDVGDYPKISNELYDLKNEGPPLAKGTQLKSLTGVLTYFYGFKIAPRSPEDFELSNVSP